MRPQPGPNVPFCPDGEPDARLQALTARILLAPIDMPGLGLAPRERHSTIQDCACASHEYVLSLPIGEADELQHALEMVLAYWEHDP